MNCINGVKSDLIHTTDFMIHHCNWNFSECTNDAMNGRKTFCRLLVVCSTLLIALLVASNAMAQSKPSFGQQIAVMKILQPDLKIIGVIGSGLPEKEIQDITRAGLAQGIRIVVGLPQEPRDISMIYKRMISENKIQILWIPNVSDDMVMGVGFEYLRSNTVLDKIGLCIPSPTLLSSGAYCCVQMENGKVTVYVNQKIASLLGARIPADESSSVTYVSQ